MSRRPCTVTAALLSGLLVILGVGPVAAVQVGDMAPTFSLPATTVEKMSLADYLGKKNLVVFFYIAAFGRA